MAKERMLPLERHLGELRYRLMVCAAALIVGLGVAWWRAGPLLERAEHRLGADTLLVIRPAEGFSAFLSIAFIGGLALAFPVIMYQVLAFVVPGLKRAERRLLYACIPAAVVLFLSGAAFAYTYIVPFTWRFFMGFAVSAKMQWAPTVSSFISFLIGMSVPVGLVFEWPLIVLALSRLGILRPATLRRGRRIAYVLILIVGAAITPPEVVAQLSVSVPLSVLYEIGIVLSGWAYRQRNE